MWTERTAFLRTWLQRPLEVGSVLPSSPRLARRIASLVDWDRTRTLVELGAGTGAVTAGLLARASASTRLLAFERQPEFRQILQDRFAGLEVYPEARQLSRVLESAGPRQAETVVSGIPFALLSRPEQEALLDEIDRGLAPGGSFIAFQYSPFLLPSLRRRFEKVSLHLVLANLPPALIYCCRKGEQ